MLRIQIRVGSEVSYIRESNPDPKRLKFYHGKCSKLEKICSEGLDVLYGGSKASPGAGSASRTSTQKIFLFYHKF